MVDGSRSEGGRRGFSTVALAGLILSGACLTEPVAQVTEANRQALLTASPAKATAAPKKARSLLIFQKTSGWTPPQRALVDTAMSILGRKTGAWKVDMVTEDANVMAPASLARFDAILMNNCNELLLSESQSKALQDFVKAGKGVLGLGSTISIRNWPEESEMWSGFCYGHPIKGNIPVRVEDPAHPLTGMFDAANLRMEDTWYVIYSPTSYSRKKVRVLLSYKWAAGDGPDKDDFAYPWIATGDYPLSYTRDYGKGRVYFNDFMHLKATPIFDKAVLQHLADATQWAFGDLDLPPETAAAGPVHSPMPYTGPTRGDASKMAEIISRIKAKDPEAILDLAKIMPDPRASAAFPAIVDMLATVAGSWYISQRSAMMVARMGMHGAPLAPLIVERLAGADAAVKIKLFYALEEMGPAAASAIPAMQAALQDADWLVRQGAAQALGNAGAAGFAAHLEMIKSTAWFTRFQGAQGLAISGAAASNTSKAIEALQGLSEDPDPEVVNAVRRSLVQLGSTVGLPRLVQSMDKGTVRARLRMIPVGEDAVVDAFGLDGRSLPAGRTGAGARIHWGRSGSVPVGQDITETGNPGR